MIAPLLVLVAHGLDALTFLWAVELWGLSGEANPIAHYVVDMAGIGGLLLMKAGGAAVAATIVARARHWRTGKLLFASAAGIVGATSNLTWVALSS
jgi:hypothetical protein